MNWDSRKEATRLFIGDIFLFLASLWLMLVLRFGTVPDSALFLDHLFPFSILFVVWVLVFFIAGLYEKHTLILRNKLPSIILNAQVANIVIAVVFFYFIPYFGITPKTNLFIYLFISFWFIFVWRIYSQSFLKSRTKQHAILIGSGNEMRELKQEVNNNSMYNLHFISSIDLDQIDSLDFQQDVFNVVYSENVAVIAVDLRNEKVTPVLPNLYNLIFSKIKFIDMHKIYEDIFDRIPLSLVKYSWFLENISLSPHATYDALKRLMDIVLSLLIGSVSLIFYPFIMLAIMLEDRGPVFFVQERIGKNNKLIKVFKFRTMKVHQEKDGLAPGGETVTRIGKLLRKTRLDEFPQLWNVLTGDLALIGPRPEVPALVKLYEKEIPYYNVRHLIKPGLSGWAQLYQETPPKFTVGYDETKIKLSYDLYYIKNRSFILDVKVVLQTIKKLLSQSGV